MEGSSWSDMERLQSSGRAYGAARVTGELEVMLRGSSAPGKLGCGKAPAPTVPAPDGGGAKGGSGARGGSGASPPLVSVGGSCSASAGCLEGAGGNDGAALGMAPVFWCS